MTGAPLRVVHTSAFVDPANRRIEALLEAWPTLLDVATAAALPGIVEVTVVQAAAAAADFTTGGVRVVAVEARSAGRLRRRMGHWAAPLLPALEASVAALRADIVHVHSLSFPRQLARLADRLPDTPLLVQDHADRPAPPGLRGQQRRALARAAAIAFTAAEQAEPFRAAGVLADTPIVEIPESSSRFTPGDRTAARRTTGLYGEPCLLWLGHLDPNKDPLCVLQALRLAAAALPDAHLWMVWRHAPLLSAVRSAVDRDPVLRQRVHLLGGRPHADIEMLLRSADFLLQASHAEGSGYAVIEALACGVTPIVTAIPSFTKLTADGRCGGLSPVGDAGAMATSLVRWAAIEPGTRRDLATQHFEHALSFEAIGARLRHVYGRLAANVQPSRRAATAGGAS